MRTLLTYLPALACLAMILVVCGPMLLKRDRSHQEHGSHQASSGEVALREEVARLRAELALQVERERVDG